MSGIISADQVRTRLIEACAADGSQAQFSRRTGLSPAYVSSVINGSREPGKSLLDVLGLVRVTGYRAA